MSFYNINREKEDLKRLAQIAQYQTSLQAKDTVRNQAHSHIEELTRKVDYTTGNNEKKSNQAEFVSMINGRDIIQEIANQIEAEKT